MVFITVSPAVVYLAVTRLTVEAGAGVVAAWIALRVIPKLIISSREERMAVLKLPAVGILFAGLGAITNDRRLLLLLPSATQFGFAWVFASSLRRPASGEPSVPLVERFARMQKAVLTDEEVRYCRSVTVVWIVFLSASGVLGLLLAVLASPAVWAIFTGIGAYILVAALFGIEYAVRKVRFRSFQSSPLERVLFRFFRRLFPGETDPPRG